MTMPKPRENRQTDLPIALSAPLNDQRQRRLEVVRLWKEGVLRQGEIAARTGVARSTVKHWLDRYQSQGLAGLLSGRNRGLNHPRVADRFLLRRVRELEAELGSDTLAIRKGLATRHGIWVTRARVESCLRHSVDGRRRSAPLPQPQLRGPLPLEGLPTPSLFTSLQTALRVGPTAVVPACGA